MRSSSPLAYLLYKLDFPEVHAALTHHCTCYVCLASTCVHLMKHEHTSSYSAGCHICLALAVFSQVDLDCLTGVILKFLLDCYHYIVFTLYISEAFLGLHDSCISLAWKLTETY